MALVAYSDDSDLESDSDDIEKPIEPISNGPKKSELAKNEVSEGGHSDPNELEEIDPRPRSSKLHTQEITDKPKSGIDSIVDFDEDENHPPEKKSGLLASIPNAKTQYSLETNEQIEEADELTDVPTVETWGVTQKLKDTGGSERNKSSGSVFSKKKKAKTKVQIILPSLSEFAEEEEEEEEEVPERKKLKPSTQGTGLFAVLPEPKNITVKAAKRSLVPHVLTKRPEPPVKKPKKPPPVPSKHTSDGRDSDDDEDNSEGMDFFSLSEAVPNMVSHGQGIGVVSSAPEIQPITTPLVPPTQPEAPQTQPEAMARVEEPVVYKHTYTDYSAQYGASSAIEQVPYAEHVQSTPDSLAIDQEALLRLAGKRRGKEAINFIDVSADDALLTRDEWMTKALTEEKPSQSFSKKREGMPSQRQKQKHQITFLAHQAKERELELKNDWAQNRMTKMQTQAKYGF